MRKLMMGAAFAAAMLFGTNAAMAQCQNKEKCATAQKCDKSCDKKDCKEKCTCGDSKCCNADSKQCKKDCAGKKACKNGAKKGAKKAASVKK